MGSSFAVRDWTIGCFSKQLLLWRVSDSSCMSGTPAFLSSRSTSSSLEVLMPSLLLISFWIMWASLLHHIAYESSATFLKNICRDSFLPGFYLQKCVGLCSPVWAQNVDWRIPLQGSHVDTTACHHPVSALHSQSCRLRKISWQRWLWCCAFKGLNCDTKLCFLELPSPISLWNCPVCEILNSWFTNTEPSLSFSDQEFSYTTGSLWYVRTHYHPSKWCAKFVFKISLEIPHLQEFSHLPTWLITSKKPFAMLSYLQED